MAPADLYKPRLSVYDNLAAHPELQPIADQPGTKWLTSQSDADAVPSMVSAAAGKTMVLCLYGVPGRDSGGYSSGGFPDRASYLAWVTAIKNNLGSAPAILIFEPDALGQTPSMTATARAERVETLRQAVDILAGAANAETYIDASFWIATADQVNMLISVDVAKVAGFAVNTSAFELQANCYSYGDGVVSGLAGRGVSGKKYVVDSSRNGNGPLTSADGTIAAPWLNTNQPWCNPPKRKPGLTPGSAVSSASCRANLWIKILGESDGTFPSLSASSYFGESAPSAGTFWVPYARDLLGLSPQPSGSSPAAAASGTPLGQVTAAFTSDYGVFTHSGATSLVGGRAHIPADTTYQNIATPQTYTLVGSSVYAQVFPPSATGATANARLQFLIASSTVAASTRLAATIDTKANTLNIGNEVNYSDAGAVVLTFDPVAHAWLRWRESAGTVFFDTSPDGLAWTQRRSLTRPSWMTSAGDTQAQFVAYKDAGTGYAEVDNVNTAPAATATPSSSLLAGADFSDTFTSLDLKTGSHEGLWLASSNYVGNGLNGYMDEGSHNSWNANPNQSANGITLNPFTIASTDGSINGPVLGIHLRKYGSGEQAAATAMGANGGTRYGGILIMNENVRKISVGKYIEWRMRCPNPGKSMWPALWLYAAQGSNGNPAEIDMLEIAGWGTPSGNDTDNGQPWHITNHTDAGSINVLHDIHTDTTSWHTYGVYWDYGKTVFYKDRTKIASWTGTYFDNKQMSVRMNFTSTVNYEYNPPMPDDIRMEVDYVAYWATNNAQCPVTGQ